MGRPRPRWRDAVRELLSADGFAANSRIADLSPGRECGNPRPARVREPSEPFAATYDYAGLPNSVVADYHLTTALSSHRSSSSLASSSRSDHAPTKHDRIGDAHLDDHGARKTLLLAWRHAHTSEPRDGIRLQPPLQSSTDIDIRCAQGTIAILVCVACAARDDTSVRAP